MKQWFRALLLLRAAAECRPARSSSRAALAQAIKNWMLGRDFPREIH